MRKQLVFLILCLLLFGLLNACKPQYATNGEKNTNDEATGLVPRKAPGTQQNTQLPLVIQTEPSTTASETTEAETTTTEVSDTGAAEDNPYTPIASEVSLKQYPTFLGKTKIVVGQDAPALDVITATSIQMALNNLGVNIETILAKEVASKAGSADLIVIGQPCVNPFVNTALGMAANDCSSLSANTAKLRLVPLANKEIVVLAAASSADLKKAADVLINPAKYLLLGKKVNLNTVGGVKVVDYN